MIKPIYALWISYPISCLRLDWHQAGSFLLPSTPGPSRSHRTAPKKPMDSSSLNLDPESLYPWRPDHSYLAHHYRPPSRCVFQGVGVTSALHNASFHCSCRAPNSCPSSLAEWESC
ncbi:hypothetical protein CHARACLAT_001299 [Characodon lateralis]|uniref:Uncharacterized protein n=1 Tax=Characodon lateralis TaxID=208331 RepID=A0ABU7CXU9_9TELE|nr:hypothetical protein [Characodon lateralis]